MSLSSKLHAKKPTTVVFTICFSWEYPQWSTPAPSLKYNHRERCDQCPYDTHTLERENRNNMSRGQRKMYRQCNAEAKSAMKVCHPGRSPTPPEPQTSTINQRLIFFSLPSYTFCSHFADVCRLVQQLIQLKALYVPEQSFTSYTGKWWSRCSPAHLFPRKKNQTKRRKHQHSVEDGNNGSTDTILAFGISSWCLLHISLQCSLCCIRKVIFPAEPLLFPKAGHWAAPSWHQEEKDSCYI